MLRNYLTIAFRRFWRQKIFTIINVLGLSTGLAISLVMLASVKFQRSFDNFHVHGDRIYKVGINLMFSNEEATSHTCSGAWAEAIKTNFPEIEMKCRIMPWGEHLFSVYDESGEHSLKFLERNGAGVDSTFFEMFTFQFKQGNAEKALTEPNSIVISEKLAKKYFGTTNPIGRIIEINKKYNFKVTGVLQNPPENTNFRYEYFFPVSFLSEFDIDVDGTIGNTFQTFFLLREGTSPENIRSNLKEFLYSRFERDVEYDPFFISLKEVVGNDETSDNPFVKLFMAIALFILIMACINFMNLSTATSLKRSKEIAIRKIVGAHRNQLIKQLLSESIVLAFISLNIAIVFSEFIVEYFQRVLEIKIPLYFNDFNFWIQLVILTLVTGVLSGSYPALFLSSFKPVKVLAYTYAHGGGGKFRKILVVFQFGLTILFLTLTSLSYNQYRALKKDKTGLETENILSVPITGKIGDKYEIIKNDLLKNPHILSVTSSDQNPTWVHSGEFLWGTSPGKNENLARVLRIDYDFLDVFGIKLIDGRSFSKEFPADAKNSIIVNEEIVKQLEIEDPIGSQFYLYNEPYTIIGVVEYFDFFTLNLLGKTLMLKLEPPVSNGNVYIKFEQNNDKDVLKYAQKIFEEHNNDYPFKWSLYTEFATPIEETLKSFNNSLTFFTIFGVLIAALGLLGLSAFMVEQKTKEIGIRKAMGASISKVVSIISKQFLRLILVAHFIAVPLSLLVYVNLRKFMTIKSKGDIFIFGGVSLFIFLLATIIIYAVTIKAARVNPADSLRYE